MKRKHPESWREHLELNQQIERGITERANETLEEVQQDPRKKVNPLDQIDVRFTDEFAPSEISVGVSDPSHVEGPGRCIFYGDDWHNIAMAAVERCYDFHLPRLCWPFLGRYTRVDEDYYIKVVQYWGALVVGLEEGSEDWICFQVYYKLLNVSQLYTQDCYNHLLFDEVFKLGGLVRELDLVNRNKKDALKAKKQNKALGQGNEGRDVHNSQKKKHAQEWRRHAVQVKATLKNQGTKSAIAQNIIRNWNLVGVDGARPRCPAKKTIQTWLSETKD